MSLSSLRTLKESSFLVASKQESKEKQKQIKLYHGFIVNDFYCW